MKHRPTIQRILAWITMTALLLASAACTKAPREDVAAKTNTERLEETAIMTPAPAMQTVSAAAPIIAAPTFTPTGPLYGRLGAPGRYTVQLAPTSPVVTITVDANVYLPDTDRLPTIHVTPRDFTQEEVTKLFQALCGDTVMYKARQQMTRAEILDRIRDVEAELETATDPDRIRKLKDNLAYWQEEYGKAPETVPVEIADGTLEERQLGLKEYLGKYMALDAYEHQDDYYTFTGKSFHVHGQTYDKNLKSGYDFPIDGGIWYDRDQSFGQYLNDNARYWIADESAVPAEAMGLTMTPAQARQLVEAFWADNGFEDMAVSGVYLTRNSDAGLGGGSGQPDPYGDNSAYVVTCGRSILGVMAPVDSGDPHWSFEGCTFTITDHGIESFNWHSPYAYGNVTTEDSALLPFSAIDEIFQKMMLVKYDLTGNANDLISAVYRIDRVVLEMSRVTNRKSSEKGLLVPVWNFYGSFSFTYENGHTYSSDERQGLPSPLLRINAIDGTVIEPRYGC